MQARIRRLRNIVGWCCAGLVGLVVLVLAVGLLAVNSPAGERWITRQLDEALRAVNMTLTCDAYTLAPPLRLSVRELRLADDQGVWLYVPEAHLALNPLAFLSGRVAVQECVVRDPILSRLPNLPASDPKPERPSPLAMLEPEGLRSVSGTVASVLRRITLNGVQFENVQIGEAVSKIPLTIEVTGNGALTDWQGRFAVTGLLPHKTASMPVAVAASGAASQAVPNGTTPVATPIVSGTVEEGSALKASSALTIHNVQVLETSGTVRLTESAQEGLGVHLTLDAALQDRQGDGTQQSTTPTATQASTQAATQASGTAPALALQLAALVRLHESALLLQDAKIQTAGLEVSAEALGIQDGALQGALHAEWTPEAITSPLLISLMPSPPPVRKATATVGLSGTPQQPVCTLEAHSAGLLADSKTSGYGVDAHIKLIPTLPTAALLADPKQTADTASAGLQVTGEISLTDTQPRRTVPVNDAADLDPSTAQGVHPPLTVKLDVQAVRTQDSLRLSRASLQVGDTALSGAGTLHAATGKLATQWTLDIAGLRQLLSLPLVASRLAAAPPALKALDGTVRCAVDVTQETWTQALTASAQVRLKAMRWGVESLQQGLGDAAELDTRLVWHRAKTAIENRLELQHCTLTTHGGAQLGLTAAGSVTGGQELDFTSQLEVGALRALSPLVSGATTLRVQAKGLLPSGAPTPRVAEKVSQKAGVRAEKALAGQSTGTASSLKTHNGGTRSSETKKRDAGLTVRAFVTSSRLAYGQGGSVSVLEDFQGEVEAFLSQQFEGHGHLRLYAAKLLGGGARLEDSSGAALRLETLWEASPARVRLTSLRGTAAGMRLTGQGEAVLAEASRKASGNVSGTASAKASNNASPTLTGEFELAIMNWKAPSALLGTRLQGAPASLALHLRPEAGRQGLDAQWKVDRLRGEGFFVRDLTGSVNVQDLFGRLALEVAASSGRGMVSGRQWTQGHMTVQGDLQALQLDLGVQGQVTGNVMATAFVDARRLEIHTLEGRLTQDARALNKVLLGIRLERPVTVDYAQGLNIDTLALSLFPAGTVTVSGALDAKRLALQAELAQLPVTLLQPFVSRSLPEGTIQGTMLLQGTPARPQGSFSLQATKVAFSQTDMEPVSVAINGRLEGKATPQLVIQGQVDGLGASQAGDTVPATLNMTLPLRFDASGIPSIPPTRPLSGAVHWEGALASLWTFVPLANTSLTGSGYVDATLAGTLAQPQLAASVRLTQAAYEDVLLGLQLDAINAVMEINPDAESTLTASAGDGQGGTVQLEGTIGSLAQGLPLQLHGTIQNLAPLHRNDLYLVLSGKTAIEGVAVSPLIQADIVVEKGRFQIVRSFGSSIPTLPVEEIQSTHAVAEQASTPSAPEEPAASTGARLEVGITIPHAFYVQGAGLESEWKGALRVRGAAANPKVTGELASLSGQFALLGKQFVVKRGVISFTGSTPPDPLLNLLVTYATPELVAEATVGGVASKPTLTLSSQPPLPQDEIVAQVLFGRSASELGRMEALQLATEIGTLATFGGGEGLLGDARKALGLDVLRFGSMPQMGKNSTGQRGSGQPGQQGQQTGDDNSIPSLEVGKYVMDNVYVGLEQGMNGDTGGVRVEIELSPHVNVDGRTTPQGSEVGINWKKDY